MPLQCYKQIEPYGNTKPSIYLFIYLFECSLYKYYLTNYWKIDYTKMETADNQGYYSCYLLKVVTTK